MKWRISFTNKYLEMAKEYIPTKIVNIRRTDKPWFNSEISNHIRIRDRLHRKLKSSIYLLFSINHHNLTRYREIHMYNIYNIQ